MTMGCGKKLLVVTVQISEMRMMKEQDVEKVCVWGGGRRGVLKPVLNESQDTLNLSQRQEAWVTEEV